MLKWGTLHREDFQLTLTQFLLCILFFHLFYNDRNPSPMSSVISWIRSWHYLIRNSYLLVVQVPIYLTLVPFRSFICVSQAQHLVLEFLVLSVSVYFWIFLFLISWTTHVFGQKVRINPWKTLFFRVIYFHRSKEKLGYQRRYTGNPRKVKKGDLFSQCHPPLPILLPGDLQEKNLVWRPTPRNSEVGIQHRSQNLRGNFSPLSSRQIQVKVISHFELGNQNSGGCKFHFVLACFPVCDK